MRLSQVLQVSEFAFFQHFSLFGIFNFPAFFNIQQLTISIFQIPHSGNNYSNTPFLHMFSATFPRPGREPLRIGTRGFRDRPQILQLSLGHRSVLSCWYLYVGSDYTWFQLRLCCAQTLIFWHQPSEVLDPPVAIPFGPHPDSPSGSDSE